MGSNICLNDACSMFTISELYFKNKFNNSGSMFNTNQMSLNMVKIIKTHAVTHSLPVAKIS